MDKEKLARWMVVYYCNHLHKTPKKTLCQECEKLYEYQLERSRKCPFRDKNQFCQDPRTGQCKKKARRAEIVFCSNCKVRCYKPEMREAIRKVMRYSGPRMLLYHPLAAIYHLYKTKLSKKGA